ncbi:MAG TPA: hypothetical protein VGM92_12510 [Candidatus Kapabacteria bacterium]
MKQWQLWAVVAVAIAVCFVVTDSVVRFPIGLGMLRVGFLMTEQFLTKVRI